MHDEAMKMLKTEVFFKENVREEQELLIDKSKKEILLRSFS